MAHRVLYPQENYTIFPLYIIVANLVIRDSISIAANTIRYDRTGLMLHSIRVICIATALLFPRRLQARKRRQSTRATLPRIGYSHPSFPS